MAATIVDAFVATLYSKETEKHELFLMTEKASSQHRSGKLGNRMAFSSEPQKNSRFLMLFENYTEGNFRDKRKQTRPPLDGCLKSRILSWWILTQSGMFEVPY